MGGRRIVIDLVFSVHAFPLPWMVPALEGTSAYRVEDLPAINYLLISHDHYYHVDHATLPISRRGREWRSPGWERERISPAGAGAGEDPRGRLVHQDSAR
jgi:L-ascorbate metabolism protein UlaG (beta-lactamase superfamily)